MWLRAKQIFFYTAEMLDLLRFHSRVYTYLPMQISIFSGGRGKCFLAKMLNVFRIMEMKWISWSLVSHTAAILIDMVLVRTYK